MAKSTLDWTTYTTDAKVYAQMAKQLATSIGKAKDRSHVVLMSAVIHAIDHGNATVLTNFINAIGGKNSAVRSNDMVKWLRVFGCFTIKQSDGDKFTFGISKATREELVKVRDEHIQKMNANPWFNFIEQKPFDGVDIMKLIHGLIKKANTKKEEAEALGPEAVAMLKGYEMLPKLEALLNNTSVAATNVVPATNADGVTLN